MWAEEKRGLDHMEYEIINYRSEFKDQFLELARYLWSSDITLNAAYMEWKHEQNPYMDSPCIQLTLYKGRVVAQRAMFGAKWQVGSPPQTILVPCGGDAVVAPDHRGRGLVGKMIQFCLHDMTKSHYKYALILSGTDTTHSAVRGTGWRWVSSFQTMRLESHRRTVLRHLYRYTSRLPILASAARGLGQRVYALRSRSSANGRHPFYTLDKNSVLGETAALRNISVERAPRPEVMTEIVERINYDGRMRHVRDHQYFEWRYLNPLSRYRFLFWEDIKPEGYLVLQTSRYGTLGQVRIVDLEVTNTKVLRDLLYAIMHWGKFEDLNIWSATLPDETKTVLRNSGFGQPEETNDLEWGHTGLKIRAVDNDLHDADWVLANRRLLDMGAWDLRWIDSDSL